MNIIEMSNQRAPLALREDDSLIPPERPTRGPEVDDLDPKTGISEADDMEPSKPKFPSDSGIDDGLLPGRNDFPLPEDPMISRKLPDLNVYQQRKTLAQAMMDITLLSANTRQLRYVLDAGPAHDYYYLSLCLIISSIIFQVAVGILLLWNSSFNIKKEHHIVKANKINNITLIGIFLITIVNVFIAVFGLLENKPPNIEP